MGFGGEAEEWRCWPNIGMGLVVTFGSGMGVAEVEAAAFTARLETICREYVGYGPGPRKSRLTISSKLDNIGLSTVSSQSR